MDYQKNSNGKETAGMASKLHPEEFKGWGAFALAIEVSAYKGRDNRASLVASYHAIRAAMPSKPFEMKL